LISTVGRYGKKSLRMKKAKPCFSIFSASKKPKTG